MDKKQKIKNIDKIIEKTDMLINWLEDKKLHLNIQKKFLTGEKLTKKEFKSIPMATDKEISKFVDSIEPDIKRFLNKKQQKIRKTGGKDEHI